MRTAIAAAVLIALSSSATAQTSARYPSSAEASCPSYFTTDDIPHCSSWGSPPESQELAARLASILVRHGFFRASEFQGVRIHWCSLGRAHGTAVDHSLVYLDTGTLGQGLARMAAVLAHEMVHVRQYRRLGQAGFQAAYRRGRVACRCCIGRHHVLERDAHAMEWAVYRRLRGASSSAGRHGAVRSARLSAATAPGIRR